MIATVGSMVVVVTAAAAPNVLDPSLKLTVRVPVRVLVRVLVSLRPPSPGHLTTSAPMSAPASDKVVDTSTTAPNQGVSTTCMV